MIFVRSAIDRLYGQWDAALLTFYTSTIHFGMSILVWRCDCAIFAQSSSLGAWRLPWFLLTCTAIADRDDLSALFHSPSTFTFNALLKACIPQTIIRVLFISSLGVIQLRDQRLLRNSSDSAPATYCQSQV
ncbi:hypothetical protein HGRIS_008591 [Hohenbuehelia grisea]|uniref:Uncharacterized protein n=1 Tax=Hohenbuehelia grisea TaxID=104357 RepID=A0ABR3J8H4_9AGAR